MEPTTTAAETSASTEASAGLSKKAQKKLERAKAKAERKAKLAAERAARDESLKQQEAAATNYGTLPLIQSTSREGRAFTAVSELNASKEGQEVLVRARLHVLRGKGNLCFLKLRDGIHTVQAVAAKSETITRGFLKFVSSLNQESLLEVTGKVTKVAASIESCSQKDVELSLSSAFVLSSAPSALPIQVVDCEVPESVLQAQDEEIDKLAQQIQELTKQLGEVKDEKKQKEIERQIEELTQAKSSALKSARVNQKQRLDNRILDLRTCANQAIFRVQSQLCTLFREFLLQNSFVEIHTPKLIGAASEGGAEVFTVNYFSRNAYLAQSPQLYKQMAVCTGLGRVFEIGPVFRAENSHTHRHMCEFVGLDMEMEFREHYHEVLDMFDGLFTYIFDGLKTRCNAELEIIRTQYPFEDLKYRKPQLRLNFAEAIEMLRNAGEAIGDLDDLDTPQEKLLGKLVKEKYDVDFFMLDKFPSAVRPFYTMKDPTNAAYSNSYDFFLRGEEILSGAQRIHDADMLTENATKLGINLETIQPYIDSFKYGAPPHAGGGIGMERVVMLYLGLNNIRKASMFPRDPHRLYP